MYLTNPNKKRKLNVTHLQPIPYLLCNLCKDEAYNYKECCNQWIYCGFDWFHYFNRSRIVLMGYYELPHNLEGS